MKTDLQRIVRSGMLYFYRNTFLSWAGVVIMVITLFIISSMLFFNAGSQYSIAQIKNRVDINVYFYPNTPQSQIETIGEKIKLLPQVATVEYTTREQALAQFMKKHENDALTTAALAELGTNPLGGSISIRAKDTDQYETIVTTLSGDFLTRDESLSIERLNYYQNKTIIERLTAITHSVKNIVGTITVVFVLLSMSIIYSMVRLAIYANREEIHVMHLVGAQKRYIHGPFMVAGMMTGIIAALLTSIILYPVTAIITSKTASFLGGFSLLHYYTDNLIMIVVLLCSIGAVIGAIAAGLSVHSFINKNKHL